MVWEFLGGICQAVMLVILVSEIYVIRKLYRYPVRRWQFLLMAAGLVELFLMGTMLVASEQFRYCFIGSTLLFLLVLIPLYRKILKWKDTRISTDAIKEGLDDLPVGICFHEISGRPVLLNNKMNEISRKLTGENLIDGNHFWNQVMTYNKSDNPEYALILLSDGQVCMLKQNLYDNMLELTATDITEDYRLNLTLEEENESLRQHNQRLKEYNKNIEQLTREKEILETKIHIHDELGRMLLSAKKTIQEDRIEDREEVLRLWRANNELLLQPASGEESNPFEEIKKVAATIGVRLLYSGDYPAGNGETSSILLQALHECITNTVSHAGGNELTVVFTQLQDSRIRMECRNNGRQPQEEITEGGGLSSLRKRVEDTGGRMKVYGKPYFKLEIELENL